MSNERLEKSFRSDVDRKRCKDVQLEMVDLFLLLFLVVHRNEIDFTSVCVVVVVVVGASVFILEV